MKSALARLVALILLAVSPSAVAAVPQGKPVLDWSTLAPLPDSTGLTGAFAGVSNGVLIIAGGASRSLEMGTGSEQEEPEAKENASSRDACPLFQRAASHPSRSSREDARDFCHDRIFLLELTSPGEDAIWREAKLRLPRPLAHGVSLTTSDGLLCIGGGDSSIHYRDVFLLRVEDGELARTDLPPTPLPTAFACGAIVGDIVYVVGGRESPDAPKALKTFWELDLSRSAGERQWCQLEPWPGRPRMLAVAGAQGDSFFLMSGVDIVQSDEEVTEWDYLRTGYAYSPRNGWRCTADLPWPVVAAPSPAPRLGQTHLAIVGGDDGQSRTQGEPQSHHPGSRRDLLAYEPTTDTWTVMGEIPTYDGIRPPITTTTVPWEDGFLLPGGEVHPGVSSPQILKAQRRRVEAVFSWLDYAAIAVYLAGLVAMGVYFSRRESTTDDFFLGGRRIPWWAAGLSIFGTQLSAITFMAIPAKAFATDWVYLMGHVAVVAVTPLLIWAYLPFYRRLNVTTAYEYLEKRFNVIARLLGSAAFILLQLGRMGVVLYLPAIALSAVTGVNVYLCIVVMGVLATTYTVLGGIEAVVWTDVVQVAVLIGGAVLSLLVIVCRIDGGVSRIVEMGAAAHKFRMVNPTWDIATTAIWVVVVGKMIEGLVPFTADQTVVQRYLTTRDEKQAARSIWANASMIVPSGALFFTLGTALWAFYKLHPNLLAPLDETDRILPWFVAQQLPAGISGLVIAALFAAAMSSLDSSMNSIATALTTDWYRRFRPHVTDHHCLTLARWATVALGVLGTGLALYMAAIGSRSLYDQYLRIVGLFGGGVAGLFFVGIFTRRANGLGAIVGFFTSGVVIYFVRASGAVHFFLYAAIGIVTCAGVTWLVSYLVPSRKDIDGLTIHTLPPK